MEKIKSLQKALSEYLLTSKGFLEKPEKNTLKALKNNLKRLELMESYDLKLFNDFLSCLDSKEFEDKPFVFIQYYVSIIFFEAKICDENYEQIENSVLEHLTQLDSLNFQEKLFKTVFFVFQDLFINDIWNSQKFPEKNDLELSEILEKLIKRTGINYVNLKNFIFDKILNKGLLKTIKFFFFQETVYYSQVLRSRHERKYRPNTEDNTKTLKFSLFTKKNSSNSQEFLYQCTILPKGYPHTKIFSEDGIVYIGGIYKHHLENDILIDIPKNNLYRLVLISKSDGFYIDCVNSIYRVVNIHREEVPRYNEFFAFNLLKTGEIVEVQAKMTIKIGKNTEFYVKKINFAEKTLKIVFTAGYLIL